MSILQQINFTGSLKEDDDRVMIFISEKQQKNYFKLFFKLINSFRIIRIMEYQNICSMKQKILNL